MSNIINLLQDLGRDADLAAEYERDPEAVMGRYELSDAEREALRGGDLDAVRSIAGTDRLRLSNSTIKPYD